MKTGGGPFKHYQETNVENIFLRIIPHEKIDSFDSDTTCANIPSSETNLPIICSEHVFPENNILSVSSSPSSLVNTKITSEAFETPNALEKNRIHMKYKMCRNGITLMPDR